MNYYYKKYEWSAFTEADLLKNGKNGTDFGKGDSFVAGSPTTILTTYDNDSSLSGGSTNWQGTTYSNDTSGQNGYVNGVQAGCRMYAEQYHVLKGSDGKTYYLIEIKIEGHDSAGAGNGYFTYYGAQPPAGTTLTVTGTSCGVGGSLIDYSCLGAGKTAPPNTPPTFTNIPANGVFCVSENTRLVIDLNASDKDCDTLSFSIAGGADGTKFTIDAKTGVLSFVTAPDYEKPNDSNGDNIYKVIVQVSDGKGGLTARELTVNVCDVKEDLPKCVVIEAEDMKLSCYTVKGATTASGGEYIALTGYNGSASTTFSGAAGAYDLSLRYWDGAGDGNIKVYVNGTLVQTVRLNANNNSWHEISVKDLGLKAGDVVTLRGDGNNCEAAIIDKVKICPSEPAVKPGALEGRIFDDADKNGIDNAEAGVAGVTVQLLNAAGAVVATTTTAADGSYRFDGLNPGTYSVAFPTEVDGKVLTDANVGSDDRIDSDANVNTGQTGNYTVTAGNTTQDVDAGIKDPGTAAIEGRIFVDADDNDVDNDEAGVQGVTVKLLNAAGQVIATTVTQADGSYLFEGLDKGNYKVEFPKSVNGMVLVKADVGSDDTIDSDASQATGQTGTITLDIGQISSDNDAGLKDPATASIGNFVFLDADKDGMQDAGEAGVVGVTVKLLNAAGAVIATTTTDAAGQYLFSGLKAGTYSVAFTEKTGYDFTKADVGDDQTDSDADVATGVTAPVTLSIGEANLTVDAGLIVENTAPDAKDDAAGTCATTPRTVDVLANDHDADGDLLTITQVDGRAIAEGGSVNVDGVTVSLVSGKLVIDGSAAYADLTIGQKAQLDISYTVSDGNGGFDTAVLDMDFCGAKNTLDTIKASLPDRGYFNVARDRVGDTFYNGTVTGTGDDRLDGKTFDITYCVSRFDPLTINSTYPVKIYLADQGLIPTGTIPHPENLDVVNWILNQDFSSMSNGNGGTYTEAEIQGAIWGLTDGFVFVNEAIPAYGTIANAKEIYEMALEKGEGFVAGEGDIVGLILDPVLPDALPNQQAIIIGIDWDDLAQDCLCY